MEIRVLRYFLAVAREGSITGAANSLHVTQPTLSRQMKELEEELGHQLLIRGAHNVTLTPEGMILRQRAEEIVSMAEKTKSELSSMKGHVRGDVYIGGGETQAMRLIAEVIAELQKEYPEIRYHLHSGNAEDVTERLDKGLLDFGVLIQPTDISKYNFISIPAKDIWGVVMPKDCLLAQKENVCREDLSELPLILSRQAVRQTKQHNEFVAWFGKDFEKLNIVATYNLVYNAALLAEQNIGYVLTLDGLVAAMDNKRVCFRPLVPRLESGLDMVWKKNQLLSPAAKIFLDKIQEKFS